MANGRKQKQELEVAPGTAKPNSLSLSRGKVATGGGKPAVLGGVARASLLPPEVNLTHKARAARSALRLGVVAVVLFVAVASAGAWYFAISAQASLATAQQQTLTLASQQAEYAELRQVKQNIEVAQAAKQVGGSTEIDWKTYLVELQATLPAGVTITTVDALSSSPIAEIVPSTVPLEGARVATLAFTASSPTLPEIPDWLDGLATLTGFVDAVPSNATLQEDGTYTVTIVMHVNAQAYSGRFAPDEENN